MNNGNQPNIVPFGKYKGQPIDVLAQDPQYVEWMVGQGWFKDKYPQFYTIIINNFQEPSDTPEHNAIQAMFLDDELCARLLNLIGSTIDVKKEYRHFLSDDERFLLKNISRKRFEEGGIDVFIEYGTWRLNDGNWRSGSYHEYASAAIEIKPSIGDDWPSVLRQAMKMNVGDGHRCVVYRDFVATSVSIEQVKEMFKLSGVLLFSLDEIKDAPVHIYPEFPDIGGDDLANNRIEEAIEICRGLRILREKALGTPPIDIGDTKGLRHA